MNFSELVQARRSVRDYDLSQPVTDADLKAIFDQVILSPSAFNLQQWTFVVVREAEQKKRLRAAAMDQAQVENCGAAIVVCAKLDAHVDAPTIFAQAPEPMRERMIGMTGQMYGGNEQFARDEAIRGASLAAMTLMYAAKAHGFDTGAMIGFNPQQVAEVAGLTASFVPAMLIVMGRGTAPQTPRGYRKPVAEVVKLERFDGAGLA
ncbi:nitroreductase family protein [Immundisolibacter sp.]|uniref:nitroreductase family protein n=1 Tax=Immundisolibacter sp. TaxID=1934948 RepID=UPI003565E0F3